MKNSQCKSFTASSIDEGHKSAPFPFPFPIFLSAFPTANPIFQIAFAIDFEQVVAAVYNAIVARTKVNNYETAMQVYKGLYRHSLLSVTMHSALLTRLNA